MMKRCRWLCLMIGFIPVYVNAFTCFLTVVKDNCWLNYDVTVNLSDLPTSKILSTVLVPKGKTWSRQEFSCEPAQTFAYSATFQPIIWQNQANSIYRAKQFWGLPKAIAAGETAWEVKVCYAKDFAETPLPPESNGQCGCDFSTIPAPTL